MKVEVYFFISSRHVVIYMQFLKLLFSKQTTKVMLWQHSRHNRYDFGSVRLGQLGRLCIVFNIQCLTIVFCQVKYLNEFTNKEQNEQYLRALNFLNLKLLYNNNQSFPYYRILCIEFLRIWNVNDYYCHKHNMATT